jgi:hypothetical protein
MRVITALLAYLLVAVALPGASATAAPGNADPAAERTQRVRVSITASPEWVRKGGIVTLKGRVAGAKRGTKVTIFQKTKGKSSWSVEAVKRTNRKGKFTHREDISAGDRTYRACVKRACDSVLVHMGNPPAQATTVAISSLSASTIEAGQSFTVVGAASTNLNGRQVQVQAYDGASQAWSAVGVATVQNGQWSVATTVSTAGKAVPLRATFAGGVGLKPSTSAAATVAVYGWYFLEDLSAVEGSWDNRGAFRISGVTYPNSVTEDTETVAVDLQRSCVRFTTVVGLSDSSISGSQASVRLLADSVERYANTNLALGTGYPVTFDVTGALRLVFQPSSVTNSPDVVLGDARVLCAF